jgi:hypothetical protein
VSPVEIRGVCPAPWLILEFTDGQLEAMKWFAFGTMLIDHFGRYAFGMSEQSWAFAVSRVTFPLFALVLAVNLARPGDRAARAFRTARRLALWAGISLLPSWWARDAFLPVNVLATLALGALVFAVLERARRVVARLGITLMAAIVGAFAEFSVPGVLLVPALATYVASGRALSGSMALAGFGLVAGLNLSVGDGWAVVGTFAAAPVALALCRLPLRVRRRKWVFYASYPAHLAAVVAVRLSMPMPV